MVANRDDGSSDQECAWHPTVNFGNVVRLVCGSLQKQLGRLLIHIDA